jgi:ABC-type glycerol-3-phosphate transport system permease component
MTSAAGRISLVAILMIGLLPLLLPLVWMISTSFKPEFDVFAYPPQFVPIRLRLQNYSDVFSQAPFARQYLSSLYLGMANVIGTAIVASMAGYALARLRFPGRGVVLPRLLSALLLPNEILIVPQYALFSNLGLIGTQVPLVLEPVLAHPPSSARF